jgi:hypothetical protein
MWRTITFLGLTFATLLAILWSLSEAPSHPQLPARPTPNYLVTRRGPPPPPPPPPTWEEFVAKVKGARR